MIELFIYTIAAFGLAYVVGHSKISLPFRVLLEPEDRDGMRVKGTAARMFWALRWVTVALLECVACFGFWIGVATAYALRGHTYFLDAPVIVAMVTLGFYTAGSNFILGRATGLTTLN